MNEKKKIEDPSDTSCDCEAINQELVAQVRKDLRPEEMMLEMADVFKLFADSTRIKILCALENKELCVCDLSALLGMSKSLISHQLRKLRESKLVKFRKAGKMVYYALDDEHVGDLLDIADQHLSEEHKLDEELSEVKNVE